MTALFLDPHHPRADLKPELKAWNQTIHAECLAQLAVFPPGRQALLTEASVIPALQEVAATGLTEQARGHAQAALLALSDEALQMRSEGQKHVMLSYQWDVQATIQRLDESLKRRGYVTWFDLTNMKGQFI